MKSLKFALLFFTTSMYGWIPAPFEDEVRVPLHKYVMPTPALIDSYLKVATEYGKPEFCDENALDAVFAPNYTAFFNNEPEPGVTSRQHLKQRLQSLKKEYGSWQIEVISVKPIPEKICYRTRKFWRLGKEIYLIEAFIYSVDGAKIHKIIETVSLVPENQLDAIRKKLLED